MSKLSMIDWIALVLVIVGALNWGLIGFFEFNLVEAIFGDMTTVIKIVYDLVGIAAVYVALISMKLSKE